MIIRLDVITLHTSIKTKLYDIFPNFAEFVMLALMVSIIRNILSGNHAEKLHVYRSRWSRLSISRKFHEVQLKSCDKFRGLNYDTNDRIRAPICTCHDSWTLIICAKLYLNWNSNIKWKSSCILTRFGRWAGPALVKRVTDYLAGKWAGKRPMIYWQNSRHGAVVTDVILIKFAVNISFTAHKLTITFISC